MSAATMLLVFLVLSAPVHAWAECAWVLWANVEMGGSFADGGKWKVVGAHVKMAECEQAREHEAAMRRALEDSFLKSTGGTDVILFRCLPDTVDPRGPKR
jgi:hypothetical protein